MSETPTPITPDPDKTPGEFATPSPISAPRPGAIAAPPPTPGTALSAPAPPSPGDNLAVADDLADDIAGDTPLTTNPYAGGRRRRHRPWWGMGDILLGIPFIIVAAIAGMLLGLPFASGDQLRAMLEIEAEGSPSTVPLAILATSLVGQQLGQGAWPFIVSRWKGLGAVRDWGLEFKPIDLLLGVGTAVIAIGAASAMSAVVSNLVDLADESEADNTQFLRDAEGTPWIYVLVAAVIVGAPLAEEFFFRGLTLRAIEKRAGPVVAVIGSTIAFTLPHFIGSGLAGTAVLFASIGVVGATLGTVTVVVGRIWPAVVAHMLFNSLGAAAALGALEVGPGT